MAGEDLRRAIAITAAGDAGRAGQPIGRERECRLLAAAVRAAASRGVALLLWGDPGVGKTTLLDYAAGIAPARVLRARGVESEAVLPYATLADLIIPLRGHFAELPAVQRDALAGSLALADIETPNPYAVCAAALSVLAAAGETTPLVVLVDDLHWVDQSSQRALLFAARRLGPERVALVMSGRDDPDLRRRSADLPTLDLAGLTRADCARLLRERGREPSGAVLGDLVERTGGNPLALLEWVAALGDDQLAGDRPFGEALPAGRRLLEEAWLRHIEELPESARAALAVVGVSRSPAITVLEAALERRGLSLADLAPAEAARIVVSDGTDYEFRHPMLRSAVLRHVSRADRRAACDALAGVTSGTTRAWYRASAATGPDSAVAAELAEAAREARRRSGYDGAALAWHRAAQLNPDPAARAGLLREAATDSFLAGASARASAWCDEALTTTTDPALRADIELLRGRILTWTGHTAAAYQGLVGAARNVRDLDPARACALLTEAAVPAAMDADVRSVLQHGEEALALATTAGFAAPRTALVHSFGLVLNGRVEEAQPGLRAGAAYLERGIDPVTEQLMVAMLGQGLLFSEQDAAGLAVLTRTIDTARRFAAPAVLPVALIIRGEGEHWTGRWAEAEADWADGLHWAEELGHLGAVGYGLACLARLDGQRGERTRCLDRVSRARREIGPYRIGCLEFYLSFAAGVAALSDADYAEAGTALDEALGHARRAGLGNPRVVPFGADVVEAHVRGGRPDRAREPLAWLTSVAARTGSSWAWAAVGRCRGMLAETLDEAEEAFAEAERHHRVRDYPYERARTLLCRGEALRRFRRPAAARVPLTAAHATFESLGAAPWAARAAVELAAAGVRPLPSAGPSLLDLLSPQEIQVARAIAGGLNNAEAASVLFVSRKTVEAHLTRVYRKLGVRSRTDLTRALVAAGLVH
ncbi:AAA family ATPase [Actinoplanes sp. NPDC051343]|uniref:helix-turn-helix transcriptional regulator n=1 Tax=Actinoplanes sp. NPDC051343 TaxID=3363906 RepID=UPI0037B3F150